MFLVAVWPRGRDDRRAAAARVGRLDRRRGHHRARHRARGRVRRRAPARARCSTRPCSATSSTRATARSRWCGSRCSCSRIPLLRVLLHRRPAAGAPAALVVDASPPARRRRPRGHARHRRATRAPASRPGSRSRPTSCTSPAMACWLGGLVVLCVAVLPAARRRRAARGAAAVLRARARRDRGAGRVRRRTRRGARSAASTRCKSTDYGRLLIAKLVVFAALIVAAAFSREVVNRRFRGLPPDDEELVTADDPVLVERRRAGRGAACRPAAACRRSVPWTAGTAFDDDG